MSQRTASKSNSSSSMYPSSLILTLSKSNSLAHSWLARARIETSSPPSAKASNTILSSLSHVQENWRTSRNSMAPSLSMSALLNSSAEISVDLSSFSSSKPSSFASCSSNSSVIVSTHVATLSGSAGASGSSGSTGKNVSSQRARMLISVASEIPVMVMSILPFIGASTERR